MNSVNFLLIIPECFQIILINIFLLFAICFSYYKKYSKLAKLSVNNPFDPLAITKTSQKKNPFSALFKGYISLVTSAYIPTPISNIEPIIKLIVLTLICSSILYANNPIVYAVGLTEAIIWDYLSQLMSILICISASGSLWLSITAINRFGRYEYLFIIWLSVIGMLCLVKSYNFLILYLSIELQSLSFYMLAAMRSRTEASAEAGLKYFILSAFSSAILLLGITLIYAAVGSQNFADLNVIIQYFYSHWTNTPISLNIGLGCICISLLFKLAAAPFHAWIADVYEGSPTPITAFFAITAKIAACTALIRVIELKITTFSLLSFIAVLSLAVGSLSAMRQVKLKRLLAFSGVTNVGWFLLALITGHWNLLIIHLIVYIILSTCVFSILILPLFRTHPSLDYRQRTDINIKSFSGAITTTYNFNEQKKKKENVRPLIDHGTDSLAIKYISDLNQLHKTNSSLAFAMVIALFSLAGIPPLAGFYSKYLIINALTQTEQYFTILIALISAILSAFYYIRVIKTIYFTSLELNFTKLKLEKKVVKSSNSTFFNIGDKSQLFNTIWFKQIIATGVNKNEINTTKPGFFQDTIPASNTQIKDVANSKKQKKIDKSYPLTKKSQNHYKMFTIMTLSSNAYICAFTTILTLVFFIKPDYFCIWVMLTQ